MLSEFYFWFANGVLKLKCPFENSTLPANTINMQIPSECVLKAAHQLLLQQLHCCLITLFLGVACFRYRQVWRKQSYTSIWSTLWNKLAGWVYKPFSLFPSRFGTLVLESKSTSTWNPILSSLNMFYFTLWIVLMILGYEHLHEPIFIFFIFSYKDI